MSDKGYLQWFSYFKKRAGLWLRTFRARAVRISGSFGPSFFARARLILLLLLVAGVWMMSEPPLQPSVRRGFHKHVVKPEDSAFRLAIAIQVGSSNMHMLARVFHALYDTTNIYVVLVDSTVSARAVDRLKQLYGSHDNVEILGGRATNYEGISNVLNLIEAMIVALENPRQWAYFLSLEAYDYPLVEPSSFREVLQHVSRHEQNFFSLIPPSQNNSLASEDQEFLAFDSACTLESPEAMMKSPRRFQVLLSNVTNIYAPRQKFRTADADPHFILTRNFVDYLVRGNLPRQMLVNLANSIHSSRHYFATVALSDPEFSSTVRTLELSCSPSNGKFWDLTKEQEDLESQILELRGRQCWMISPLHSSHPTLRNAIDVLANPTEAMKLGLFGELFLNALSKASQTPPSFMDRFPIMTGVRFE